MISTALKNAPGGALTDRHAAGAAVAEGYSLPSRFAFESVRYVCSGVPAYSMIDPKRVAVVTGVTL
jgi:hypothetical protein